MIIEKNIFRIKFGKMKEAKTLWSEMIKALKPDGDFKLRVLTDLTGPAYTLVMELELKDFLHMNLIHEKWKSNQRVAELYQKFILVCDSSERILYNLEYQD